MNPRVAVLGTGRMGTAIARRLANTGVELVVWNRTRSRAEAVGAGTVVGTPAEAVAGVDVVITSLTGPDALPRSSAVEYTEAQIKKLQGTLKITEDQQELWNNLVAVMRENAKDMDAFTRERAENAKPMNAVEHLKLHRQITEEHLAQLKKLIPPFEAFYNSMSDQQKNITDIIFRTGKYGKAKRK